MHNQETLCKIALLVNPPKNLAFHRVGLPLQNKSLETGQSIYPDLYNVFHQMILLVHHDKHVVHN